MLPEWRLMATHEAEEGRCAKCGGEREVLVDGVLCEDCHGEVWQEYETQITRFGLFRPKDGGEMEGTLVAVGVATSDRAILAWLGGPPSGEVYNSLEEVMQVYEQRENLALVFH